MAEHHTSVLAVPYWLAHPLIALDTFTHCAVHSTTIPHAHIVSNETWQYIHEVRARWGIPGLSVAIVARASDGPQGVVDRTTKRKRGAACRGSRRSGALGSPMPRATRSPTTWDLTGREGDETGVDVWFDKVE